MKKLYFLLLTLLIVSGSIGQTTVFQESFETGNSGTPTETCNDGSSDFFTRTDGTDISSSYVVTGADGSFFFAAQDTDGAPCTLALETLLFDDIDISTYTNLTLAILLAEDDSSDGNEDWDGGDLFYIEVDYDNSGTFTKVMQFATTATSGFNVSAPKLDTDFDNIGDGAELTPAFTEFTAALGTGSLVDLRLVFDSLAAGDEDIALDNIRIIDGFVASPSVTISSPSNGAVFDPGTTSVDVTWSTANLSGGEIVNVTVNMGTTDFDVTSPYNITTTDGVTYNVTVDLDDGGGGILDTDTVSFSVASLTPTSDITTLRAGTQGDFFELTNEVIISYIVTDNSRNQKYIQDVSGAAILIDDPTGTLTTPFNIGDGITGLKGELSEFSNILQFVPIENVASASSTGNTITPEDVTAADFFANGENYESELIKISNITFSDAGGIFADNTNYNIVDGATTTICRVVFGDENLIGATIPSGTSSVIGLGAEFGGSYQIYPRYLSDVEGAVLGIEDFNKNNVGVYPNPTNTGYVNISAINSEVINAKVFDILGKQVLESQVENNQLNVSNLDAGMYILELSQNNATTTKKLIIE